MTKFKIFQTDIMQHIDLGYPLSRIDICVTEITYISLWYFLFTHNTLEVDQIR